MSFTPKPLADICPETVANGVSRKRWGFGGQALVQDDVDALTAKGVDWDKDIMPDGRLKHPRFRLRRNKNRTDALARSMADPNHVHSPEAQQARWEEYQKLPDPKPDYFEWASQYSRREIYDNLERIAFSAKRDSDRTKAAAAILEYSKSKPKQIVENVNPEVRPATPDELLTAVATIFDKPVEYVREALMGKAQ